MQSEYYRQGRAYMIVSYRMWAIFSYRPDRGIQQGTISSGAPIGLNPIGFREPAQYPFEKDWVIL